jgi:hypothetical protein
MVAPGGFTPRNSLEFLHFPKEEDFLGGTVEHWVGQAVSPANGTSVRLQRLAYFYRPVARSPPRPLITSTPFVDVGEPRSP